MEQRWLTQRPKDIFKKGELVIIRELNPNHALKPGEKAGAGKLKGAIRGPFKYIGPSPISDKYGSISDIDGNIWDKAFHDMVPYDSARGVSSYRIAEFPVPTREALELESSWKSAPTVPTRQHREKKRKINSKKTTEEDDGDFVA